MFFAELNETVQTAPKRRKEKIQGEFSLIIGSEIWYVLVVPLKNCSNHGFSRLEMNNLVSVSVEPCNHVASRSSCASS